MAEKRIRQGKERGCGGCQEEGKDKNVGRGIQGEMMCPS